MEDDQETLTALETSVDRLRNILPTSQPYIQTVPQDEPRYHHRSKEMAEAWLHNAPFESWEHPDLQYQTWNYHEYGTDLIYLKVQSQVEHKAQKDTKTSDKAMGSAANTPSAGPKKKMTLAAYKDKRGNGSGNTPAQAVKLDKPEDRQVPKQDSASKKDLKGQEEPRSTSDDRLRQDVTQTTGSLKRKRLSPQASPQRFPHDRGASPTPNKKIRPSSPPREKGQNTVSHKDNSAQGSQGSDRSGSLPDRLSPLDVPLPGRLSPLHLPLLDRLSPSLPDAIVAELDRRARQEHVAGAQTTDLKPLPAGRPFSKHDSVFSNGVEHKSGESTVAALPKAVKSEQEIDEKKLAAGETTLARRQSQSTPIESSKPIKKDTPTRERSRSIIEARTYKIESAPPKRERLIVKLKIPKRLRQDYSRLLKFPSKPSKRNTTPTEALSATSKEMERSAPRRDAITNGVHRKDDVNKSKHVAGAKQESERRGRSPPASTHKRSSSVLDQKPVTPLQPPFQSPSVTSSVQKGQNVTPTPRRDLPKHSTMKIVESADRYSATPPAAGHTPASTSGASAQVGSSTTLKPSPASTGSKTAESQAWWTERERLAALGKSLKRAAAEHTTSAKTAGETTIVGRRESELAALTSIESFLAFMLSFHAVDMCYATRNPPVHHFDAKLSWVTLQGYWEFLTHMMKPYPAFHALTYQLGVVCHARIIQWIFHSRYKGPEEHAALILMSRLIEGPKLELSMLKREFPQTWKAGMDGKAASEASKPYHYDGRFELPIDLQMSPLQAVRMACSMLAEYKCKEGGNFVRKLILDGGLA